MTKVLKEYVAVMYLGLTSNRNGDTESNEEVIFVKGYSKQDVYETVRKRKWKGTCTNVFTVIKPGSNKHNFITNVEK